MTITDALPEEIPQDLARRAQIAMFAGPDPAGLFLELRGRRPGHGVKRIGFVPAGDLDRICAAIDRAARVGDVWMTAAPRTREDGRGAAVPHVCNIFADLDGPDALQRLVDFHLLPSMFVESGSPDCGHAYFAISPPLSPRNAQRANRRLMLALGGDRNATDPARILRPAGTLNFKHEPPRPVRCTALTLEVFTARQVVGGLPDSHHYRPRPPAPPREHVSGDVALGALVGRVRTAVQGERNAILFWACCRAIEDAGEGRLDGHQALGELGAAGLHVGLGEQEITATIRSAYAQRKRQVAA
jgi:hypothetical protein